jgi:CBS domain-containing protein
MAISSRSAVTVPRTSSVMETVRTMAGAKIGSVLVVDGTRLVGIFSERDVMLRVVVEGRHPEYTTVEEVMTSSVQTIPPETTADAALRIMHQSHIRHLPVVDDHGHVLAVVSMRSLMQEKIDELNLQLDSLEQYITADGIGG